MTSSDKRVINARSRRSCSKGLELLLVCTGLFGILLHALIRDQVVPLSGLYYGLPWQACGILFASASLVSFRRHPKCSRAWALASIVLLGYAHVSLRVPERTNDLQSKADTIQVFFWNAARPQSLNDWQKICQGFERYKPDVVCLVEAKIHDMKGYQALAPRGYQTYLIEEEGMVILTTGTVTDIQHAGIPPKHKWARIEVNTHEGVIAIHIVDIHSWPFYDKGKPIKEIFDRAREESCPSMVVGDFNTPVDSAWFDPVKRDFQHALLTAGSDTTMGTWPRVYPVLSIDHMWMDTQFELLETRNLNLRGSDHRALLTRFRRIPPK